MHCSYFQMVGLRFCLRTPEALPVTERMIPFLTAPCEPEITITLRPSETLPQPGRESVQRGMVRCEGLHRVFHYDTPGGAPAAVTTFEKRGDVLLEYLPVYAGWFSGFSGIFNRIGVESLLLRHDALMLHASVVSHQGKGVVFAGPSGIGKSTQSALWQKVLGAKVLNGDRTGLRMADGCWHAYGMPWAGSSGIYCNEAVPVGTVVVLGQAKENRICRITASEAFRLLYPQLVLCRQEREAVEQAMQLLLKLLDCVTVYYLECLPEESAVRLLEGVL